MPTRRQAPARAMTAAAVLRPGIGGIAWNCNPPFNFDRHPDVWICQRTDLARYWLEHCPPNGDGVHA
jgi:hypothetical protein